MIPAGISGTVSRRLSLTVDAEHIGKRYQGNPRSSSAAELSSYTLVNGKVSLDVTQPGWQFRAKLYAAGENLLDQDYAYQPLYPMPGISGMAGLELQF